MKDLKVNAITLGILLTLRCGCGSEAIPIKYHNYKGTFMGQEIQTQTFTKYGLFKSFEICFNGDESGLPYYTCLEDDGIDGEIDEIRKEGNPYWTRWDDAWYNNEEEAFEKENVANRFQAIYKNHYIASMWAKEGAKTRPIKAAKEVIVAKNNKQ